MRLDRAGAGVRLRLDATEAQVLVGALGDLLAAMDEMGPGDPVWERFYPAASTDEDAAEEFREMVGEDLDNQRRHRLQACRSDVETARLVRRSREVTLEPEGLERWIAALNDVRLALGTRLGVTADPEPVRVRRSHDAPGDAEYVQDYAVYHWLTGVQDGLVSATRSAGPGK